MKIGFVSVRFSGLDGVSLEAAKLADVLRAAGHEVVWFAGELGPEFRPGLEFPEARFDSTENLRLQQECFGVTHTPRAIWDIIASRADVLEQAILEFVAEHELGALVPQNSSSIPMQLPLGVAIARVARSGVLTVAHHHDFGWERERFSPSGVGMVLDEAFPPVAATVKHMVINSIAQAELKRRTGEDATLLPNVMDFETPPEPGDRAAFRRYAGLSDDDTVLLQATRVIPRKSIELTLELAARLNAPSVRVVVTHPDLDEGAEYANDLLRRAADLGVDYRQASVGDPGQPSLADAYAAADLVSYPSRIEGFGNALLEAVYYGCPLLVNRYPVYVADIAPTGLQAIEIEGAITTQTVAEVERWLADAAQRASAAAANYEICQRHFSYAVLRERLLPLFE